MSSLDEEMVALMHKQQQLQTVLGMKKDLCKQLTEVCLVSLCQVFADDK